MNEVEFVVLGMEAHSKNMKQMKQDQLFAHIGGDNKYITIRTDMSQFLSPSQLRRYQIELEGWEKKKNQQTQKEKAILDDYEVARRIQEAEDCKYRLSTDDIPELFDEQDQEENYESHYPQFDHIKLYSSRMKDLKNGEFPVSSKQQKKSQQQKQEKREQESESEIVIFKKKKRKKGK